MYENKTRLKRTMVQTAITGYCQTYFVVWTGKGFPLIENIIFDQDYWDTILFKTCIQNVFLGLKIIYTCPTCSKYNLEKNEHGAHEEKVCNVKGV